MSGASRLMSSGRCPAHYSEERGEAGGSPEWKSKHSEKGGKMVFERAHTK
jgi:hypothetical protein